MTAVDPRAEDELRAELAALLPVPSVPELDADRAHALKVRVLASAASPTGGGAVPRPRRRTSAVARFAVPVAVCGLVAGAVLVAAPDGPPADAPHARVADGAVEVLSRAALAAAAAPGPGARPEQFVYVESLVVRAGRPAGGGPAVVPPPRRRQVWLSVDGSRTGLLREAGTGDTPLSPRLPVYELDGPGASPRRTLLEPEAPSVSRPTHAYVAGLPTDPEALLRLVREQTRAGGGDADQRAFAAIGSLLTETWAPPRVTAALFEAAARIPGVSVLPSARDAAGREGVAVARTSGGEQTQWIFDRSTSAFLGERTVATGGTDAGPAGLVLGSTAVLAKAVVDRAGGLPG